MTSTRRSRWPLGAIALAAIVVTATVVVVFWGADEAYGCPMPTQERVDAGSYRVDEKKLPFTPTAVSPNGRYVAGKKAGHDVEEPVPDTYYLSKDGDPAKIRIAPNEDEDYFSGGLAIIDVNDRGEVLIAADDGGGLVVNDDGTRWLTGPLGPQSLWLRAIGADGTVAGSDYDFDSEKRTPLKWEPGEETATRLPVPEGLSGSASHVLDDGRIVGDLRDGLLWAESDRADAWLWDGDGKPSELSDLVEFVNADGGEYTGKNHVIAAACDWLLLKVEGGLIRTTLSGRGEAEYLTNMKHDVANHGADPIASEIDAFGRIFGRSNGAPKKTAGIFDTEYTVLPTLDGPKDNNVIMDISHDGCMVAVRGHDRKSTLSCG